MTVKVLGGPRGPEELCVSGDFSEEGLVTLHLDRAIKGDDTTPHRCFEIQAVEVGLWDQDTKETGLKLTLEELKFVRAALDEAIIELENQA